MENEPPILAHVDSKSLDAVIIILEVWNKRHCKQTKILRNFYSIITFNRQLILSITQSNLLFDLFTK